MISYLRGKIKYKGANFVVIEVGSIGYRVFVSPLIISELEKGEGVEFNTYQYVREDTLELYGFLTREELELFEQLIAISGIGPKSAMGVLAVAHPAEIKRAILKEDPTVLTKVSGIGRKTAERVILELKGKLELLESVVPESGDQDALEALMGLGYKPSEIREALRKIPSKVKGTKEKIKEALKALGER